MPLRRFTSRIFFHPPGNRRIFGIRSPTYEVPAQHLEITTHYANYGPWIPPRHYFTSKPGPEIPIFLAPVAYCNLSAGRHPAPTLPAHFHASPGATTAPRSNGFRPTTGTVRRSPLIIDRRPVFAHGLGPIRG
jgi:hypothetical protein